MTRVSVVMMQKNETVLLRAWLVYHGYLFGFENLYVIDNGSDDQEAIRIMRDFGNLGVNFDYRWTNERDYERKAELKIQTINELKENGKHDIFFPIDADEFIVSIDDEGLSCSRKKISEYLQSITDETEVLRIHTQMYNIPGYVDHYYAFDAAKVFFAKGIVLNLEHGNHNGSTNLNNGYKTARITYLHFHNKLFKDVLASALMKLKGRVDISSIEEIRSYRGHGYHLVKYFSMSERDYVNSFRDVHAIFFREFRALLEVLGVSNAISKLCETGQNLFPDEQVLPTKFDSISYLQEHPDVKEAGVQPILHYYIHGHRERRRLGKVETNDWKS